MGMRERKRVTCWLLAFVVWYFTPSDSCGRHVVGAHCVSPLIGLIPADVDLKLAWCDVDGPSAANQAGDALPEEPALSGDG